MADIAVMCNNIKQFKNWEREISHTDTTAKFIPIQTMDCARDRVFKQIIYLRGWYEVPGMTALRNFVLTRLKRM